MDFLWQAGFGPGDRGSNPRRATRDRTGKKTKN